MTVSNQRRPDLMLCWTVSVLLLFVVCTTVYMALQSRQTVAQSKRIDELEKLVGRLSKRVVRLETLLASSQVLGSKKGKRDGIKSKLFTEVTANQSQRRRRQFLDNCPCITGPPGPPGPSGANGPPGPRGPQGKRGRRGRNGDQGPKGDTGPKGDQGPMGHQGPKGDQGPMGHQGHKGDQGPMGHQGPKGDTGPKGDQGPRGSIGPKGDQGPRGSIGPKGDQGPRGKQGAKGKQGIQGPRGVNGSKGDKGDQGPQGHLSSVSIHLVGDGQRFSQPGAEQSIVSWKVNDKRGSIQYMPTVGDIVITIPGTYYIYTQMYYYNEKEHLTGHITYINDKKILESIAGISNDASQSVMQWKKTIQRGSIRYHDDTGSITIKTSGYYFVYSQMFYFDKEKPVMGHKITVNNIVVLKSISSTFPDPKRKYNTNYNGALIRLFAGDQIKVKLTTKNATYFMDPKSSFFGAFLVNPIF